MRFAPLRAARYTRCCAPLARCCARLPSLLRARALLADGLSQLSANLVKSVSAICAGMWRINSISSWPGIIENMCWLAASCGQLMLSSAGSVNISYLWRWPGESSWLKMAKAASNQSKAASGESMQRNDEAAKAAAASKSGGWRSQRKRRRNLRRQARVAGGGNFRGWRKLAGNAAMAAIPRWWRRRIQY